jgi:hypothetical protein
MSDLDLVELDPAELDAQDTGQELTTPDYILLYLLGLLLPILLIIWGRL